MPLRLRLLKRRTTVRKMILLLQDSACAKYCSTPVPFSVAAMTHLDLRVRIRRANPVTRSATRVVCRGVRGDTEHTGYPSGGWPIGFAGTKIAFARGESPSSIATVKEALSDTASASVLEWFLNIVPVSLRSKTLEKGLMEGNATTQSSRTASRGESPLGLMRKDGEIRLDTRRIRVLSMVRARGEKWGVTPANFSSAHGSPQREGGVPVRQVGFGTSNSASRGAQADAVRSGDRTKPPPGPRAQRMPCSDAGSTVQEGTSAVVAPSRTQIFGSGEG
ncbi:hypothetical protein B0H11DRAFT_2201779 [Mycena galericulata]|nr:hypothetical protein B0H11DRAFT_2201779 [Mycena galericulata]